MTPVHAWQVVFSSAKQGNDPWEWEDGAAATPEDPVAGRGPRFAMADGATEGFGSARWAMRLVEGFVGADVELTGRSLLGWASRAQDEWRHDPLLAGASGVELFKLDSVGSFATFLGCEFDLDGTRPRWRAVALGDTVLFHVRHNRLIAQFPAMREHDFGVNPAGVPTVPAALREVIDQMQYAQGDLAPGDLVYLATDALAHWMVRECRDNEKELWALLAGLDHPQRFRSLVDDRRTAREMTNDDVTLMRISVAARWPDQLVVCV